jgi:hypothetical protein
MEMNGVIGLIQSKTKHAAIHFVIAARLDVPDSTYLELLPVSIAGETSYELIVLDVLISRALRARCADSMLSKL